MDAFPEQRRERLDALVAHVLVLVPGARTTTSTRYLRLLRVRVLRDRAGHRERRVHRLEARRQRIDERDVVAPRLAPTIVSRTRTRAPALTCQVPSASA